MSDRLLAVLKSMGYSNDACRRILEAENAAEIDAISARRDHTDMSELTPLQACSGNPVKQRIFAQTRGMVKNLSKHTYDLDPTKPVDVYLLDKAIRAGSVESRCAVKSNLAQLGLIP